MIDKIFKTEDKHSSFFQCSYCKCLLTLEEEENAEPTLVDFNGVAIIPRYCPNCGKPTKYNN